jgi:trans-aconitate methyltransferase
MPDVYATIDEVEPEIQESLADVIEMRAADPRQRAMLHAYLSEIDFPPEAKVLEIGCGTGAVTRTLAQWPSVAQAIGVDPSAVFIARARSLSQGSRISTSRREMAGFCRSLRTSLMRLLSIPH